MLRSITLLATLMTGLATAPLQAQNAPVLKDVIDNHILPGFAELDATASQLDDAAATTCDPTDATLRAAYHAAFDAWIAISHIRFAPPK